MLERPKPPPKSPADRKRERHARYRQRVRAGLIVVRVEVSGDVLDWLVSVRWLTEAEANRGDSAIVGAAIARGLAVSAKS